MAKQPECVSMECIWNDKLRKGFCVGVSQQTNSYGRDVVRMCWVKQKPTPNMRCIVEMQVQMTPKESVGIGVALIRSSAIGEMLLSNMAKNMPEKKEEKNENKSNNP